MALLDQTSCLCIKSELDLFSVPPTQTSIDQGVVAEYLPVAPVRADGPIEFLIPGSGEYYLDLTNTCLHVAAKIVQADGAPIANDAAVSVANLLLHSLFSQVDIKLNDKLVTSSSNTYPYRAYLETMLDYGRAAKESQLTASMWYKDTAGAMDSIDLGANAPNAGLVKRHAHVRGDRTVEMVGRIHSDLFFQERLLLNGVKVHVRLVRSSNAFVLMAADDATFRMTIVKAVLRVRHVRLSPEVFVAHGKALELGNAKYPLNRVEVKTLTVAQGHRDTSEQIFSGQVPSRVVVGLVDTDAFNGRLSRNPFNFKHHNVVKVSLQVDGREQMQPLVCDFGARQTAEAYMNMFLATGKAFKDEDVDVSRTDFENGYTLFCFDLTPDLGEPSDHFNLIKTGSVRLGIWFGQALDRTINAIVYGEFENVLEIDRNRNVHIDYLG